MLILFASCSVIHSETETFSKKNNLNYFPRTFEEAEIWIDSIHAQNDVISKHQNISKH